MSKLPSDATLDIINKLAGGGWNGTVRVSVDAEWYEGDVTSDETCGLPYDPDADTFVFGKDGPLLSEAYLKSSQQYAADPAPEQADPDTDMAALLEAFKNIRFDDFHDVDFSDAQKENLLVHVRGWGGWGGGGRG